jgi:hypothetical protein
LAATFHAVWQHPATPDRERKRMMALLVADVTLTRTDAQITLGIRFGGGATTTIQIPPPLTPWRTRQTHPQALARARDLLDTHPHAQVADPQPAAIKALAAHIQRHDHQSGGVPLHPRGKVQCETRSFGLDVLACPRCGDRFELIALIETRPVIERIFTHLGLPTTWPAVRPARTPPLPLGADDEPAGGRPNATASRRRAGGRVRVL